MDYRLELVAVPVTDVDRAIAFYIERVGFRLDMDQQVHEGLRFAQLTPPGSPCSIAVGEGITDKEPGSSALQVVVDDVVAARAELASRGVPVSEVEEFPWGSFCHFADPDGNAWSVQQLPPQ